MSFSILLVLCCTDYWATLGIYMSFLCYPLEDNCHRYEIYMGMHLVKSFWQSSNLQFVHINRTFLCKLTSPDKCFIMILEIV